MNQNVTRARDMIWRTKRTTGRFSVILLFSFCLLAFAGCGDEQDVEPTVTIDRTEDITTSWGIEVDAIRLTAEDHMIDFRYWVRNPEKAATLLQRKNNAFLVDEATGKALPVTMTKLGPLRSSTVEPKQDKRYTILFTNANKMIKRGNAVTVVIGDFRAEGLIVE